MNRCTCNHVCPSRYEREAEEIECVHTSDCELMRQLTTPPADVVSSPKDNQESADQTRCLITCQNFPMYACNTPHQCVKNDGHPFDPMYGEAHEFETHVIPAKREFYALPITQAAATASAPTTTVIDHDVVGSGLPESNVTVAVDDWMLNHRMTTVRGTPESESSISSTLAEIDERWSGTLPQVQFSGAVKKDIDTLRSIIDRLKAEKESIRTKFPWHRGDGRAPDVPVLQPRYDALLTEVKRLQTENESLIENLDKQTAEVVRAVAQTAEVTTSHKRSIEAMRDEIVKRVREKACARAAAGDLWTGRTLDRLATELEAIQLKDEDQNEQS